jgi:hypothetical protein
MAGECLCVHAIRRDVKNSVRVRAAAGVIRSVANAVCPYAYTQKESVCICGPLPPTALPPQAQKTCTGSLVLAALNKHAAAAAPLVTTSGLTAELDLLRPIAAALFIRAALPSPSTTKICGIDLKLALNPTTTSKAKKKSAVQFTFFAQLLNTRQKGAAHHALRLPKKSCYREFDSIEEAENSGFTFNLNDIIRVPFMDGQIPEYPYVYFRAIPQSSSYYYTFGGVSWDRGFLPDDPIIQVAIDSCPEPLVITPGGDILPAFQYQAKLEKKPKAPPRKQSMDVVRNAKTEIKVVGGLAPNLTYFLDAKAELKTETTTAARANVGNMSAIIKFTPLLGDAPAMPLRSNRPTMAQRDNVARVLPVKFRRVTPWQAPRQKWRSPNDLFMSQVHRPNHCYKENNKRPPCCDPLRFKFCCIATVLPRATSEAGELTRITKKQNKLRIVQAVHPDSKKQNLDGSFPPKRYIWRFTVHPENNPPCACEFIHIGIYHFRDSVWKFNESKPVLLMVSSPDFQSAAELPCFFPVKLPVPKLYPQYTENGEYRVVMVKNLMYDIYPPHTFVRTEYEGASMTPVERVVILNEISHVVFVYEGCGGSFFLINAECD